MPGHDCVMPVNQRSKRSNWAHSLITEAGDFTSEFNAGLLASKAQVGGFKVGDVIDDYQIISVLGAGGMGEVYRVRNFLSGRVEAMKVLLPNLDTNSESMNRFLKEIKVQAALDHPNIAKLHTARRVENQVLMIMECVEGVTLEKLLQEGPIPLADGVDYICQVLQALSYAHSLGIIHRDVKPSNIIVTANGRVKLMDFGVARLASEQHLTQTGVIIGSLHYMSPEQIKDVVNLDVRSDLYSVGIVLYEIVTGRRPFHGERDYSVLLAHLQQNPVPPVEFDPKIPTDISNIIVMSIAKNPFERFQSADAFHAALKGLALPVMSTCVAAGKTGPTSKPDATAVDTHGNSPTTRNAQQPQWVAKNGTTSGLRANGKARQRLWRSLFLGVKAILGFVVLALTIVVAQKLHRGGAHFRSERALPAKVPRITAPVSVDSQIDQPEQGVPKERADADANSAGLPPKQRRWKP